jgi:CDP-diacylglycerol--serine O-phosphatidyltransferase
MIKKHIPNALTLINLMAGILAILINDPIYSPMIILAASFLDLLDGMLARGLDAYSALGGQLDSFADLISFGVAPAFLYYQHLLQGHWYEMVIVSLFPALGALRLAKFNLENHSGTSFKGLPIPSAGLLLAFMVYALSKGNLVLDEVIIVLLPLIVGFLMLLSWRMMSLKNIRDKTRTEKYFIGILFILTLVLIVWFWLSAIPLIVLLYLIFSLLFWSIKAKKST